MFEPTQPTRYIQSGWGEVAVKATYGVKWRQTPPELVQLFPVMSVWSPSPTGSVVLYSSRHVLLSNEVLLAPPLGTDRDTQEGKALKLGASAVSATTALSH